MKLDVCNSFMFEDWDCGVIKSTFYLEEWLNDPEILPIINGTFCTSNPHFPTYSMLKELSKLNRPIIQTRPYDQYTDIFKYFHVKQKQVEKFGSTVIEILPNIYSLIQNNVYTIENNKLIVVEDSENGHNKILEFYEKFKDLPSENLYIFVAFNNNYLNDKYIEEQPPFRHSIFFSEGYFKDRLTSGYSMKRPTRDGKPVKWGEWINYIDGETHSSTVVNKGIDLQTGNMIMFRTPGVKYGPEKVVHIRKTKPSNDYYVYYEPWRDDKPRNPLLDKRYELSHFWVNAFYSYQSITDFLLNFVLIAIFVGLFLMWLWQF